MWMDGTNSPHDQWGDAAKDGKAPKLNGLARKFARDVAAAEKKGQTSTKNRNKELPKHITRIKGFRTDNFVNLAFLDIALVVFAHNDSQFEKSQVIKGRLHGQSLDCRLGHMFGV
jgi:hypothetical protein